MRPWALLSLLVLAGLGGCLGADGSPEGTRIDEDALAAGWESGRPTARVVTNVGGDTWGQEVNADPVFHDLDGDGTQEIIVHGQDRFIRIIDADTGRQQAKMPVSYPPSWRVDKVLNAVAVGTLDGETQSIVVAGPAAVVTAWTVHVPAPGELSVEKAWETTTDTCRSGSGMDAPPVLADLDGKPGDEVLIHTEQVGLYALTGEGGILWHHCWAGGNAAPAVDDLDGDGDLEAVFASDSGFISVFDGKSGAVQWTFDAADEKYGIKPASVVTAPTIADIDGKGQKEVLFTARHVPRDDPDAFEEFSMGIFAVHQDPVTYQAELVWLRQPQWANALSNTRLVVQDVDGDGRADIFGMDWNTVGHSPGSWEPFEESHVFRLDEDGRDVWVRPLQVWWSNKQISLADVDGDGEIEVLAAAPRGQEDGIWRIDAGDGHPEGFLTAGAWTLSTGPRHMANGSLVVAAHLQEQDRAALIIYDLEGG